jgi:hypothetical protein
MYRAPSWSWAAVDGEVNPGQPNVETADLLITVENFHLDYSTDDKTASIEGGWLRLRGVLKQLMLELHPSLTTCNHEDWNMIVNGVHVSILTDSSMREPQPHVKLDYPRKDFKEQNAKGSLYCMPARVYKGNDVSIYVLILELVD